MKRVSPVIIGVVIAAVLLVIGALMLIIERFDSRGSEQGVKISFFSMDTMCEITLYSNNDPGEYRTVIERLDNELDRYNEQSDIYTFNEAGSAELMGNSLEIYEKSKELYQQYGCVNITCGGLTALWGISSDSPRVPSDEEISLELSKIGFDKIEQNGSMIYTTSGTKLDLGAVAKGYALDKTKELLDEKGEECAVVSMGSSSLLYGKKPDGEPFKVSVRSPFSPNETYLTFETEAGFVSTSGGYERYFEADGKRYIHILDLYTGKPSESDLASVTVICKSGIESDFLSTVIFIQGKDMLPRFLDDKDIKVIAIDTEGNVYNSPSLDDKINKTKP